MIEQREDWKQVLKCTKCLFLVYGAVALSTLASHIQVVKTKQPLLGIQKDLFK